MRPRLAGSGRRKDTGFHRHRKGGSLLALRGVTTCKVEGGFGTVPPQSAIRVPGAPPARYMSAKEISHIASMPA